MHGISSLPPFFPPSLPPSLPSPTRQQIQPHRASFPSVPYHQHLLPLQDHPPLLPFLPPSLALPLQVVRPEHLALVGGKEGDEPGGGGGEEEEDLSEPEVGVVGGGGGGGGGEEEGLGEGGRGG